LKTKLKKAFEADESCYVTNIDKVLANEEFDFEVDPAWTHLSLTVSSINDCKQAKQPSIAHFEARFNSIPERGESILRESYKTLSILSVACGFNPS
jgi:hypothetical protein